MLWWNRQIYGVDHKRAQEQMVAEVEGLREAEKLVEQYLRTRPFKCLPSGEIGAHCANRKSASSSTVIREGPPISV